MNQTLSSRLAAPTVEQTGPTAPNFDGLAAVYSLCEWLAFGRGLEQARFCLLDNLRECRDILLLGEGDGRCLARLAQVAPMARLHYVDGSPAMLTRARERLDDATRARVTFICADALNWTPPARAYNAVVTAFFLDCFSGETVAALVAKMQPALRPDAKWLWTDFVLPTRGPARWRAQMWLGAMFLFFRWQTGLRVGRLPPTEEISRAAGWVPLAAKNFHRTFTRSVVFSQPNWGS